MDFKLILLIILITIYIIIPVLGYIIIKVAVKKAILEAYYPLKDKSTWVYNRLSESVDHRGDQHSASTDFGSFDRVNAKEGVAKLSDYMIE